MKTCQIEGCTKKHFARGVCEMHYQRFRLTGTIVPGSKAHGPLSERFWRKVAIRGPNDCWLWQGNRTTKGYGRIQQGGKGSPHLSAHRVSYELHHGPIPDGAVIKHSCDNPSCVNPAHLTAGTQSENIAEAVRKGRKVVPHPQGEQNPVSRLKADQVSFIRAHDEMTNAQLAQLFGVSVGAVSSARSGENWKHIPGAVTHSRRARGERQGASRLTAEQVREIRNRPEPIRALGKIYGVSKVTISNIRARRTWRHVD